jgi:hypothetical protein
MHADSNAAERQVQKDVTVLVGCSNLLNDMVRQGTLFCESDPRRHRTPHHSHSGPQGSDVILSKKPKLLEYVQFAVDQRYRSVDHRRSELPLDAISRPVVLEVALTAQHLHGVEASAIVDVIGYLPASSG